MSRIVLASASPRRSELLAAAGVAFEVVPSTAPESASSPDGPDALVQENAWRKAQEVAARVRADYVIGADTLVLLRGDVLGKPADRADAERMIARLQGCEHDVLTGLAVVDCAADRLVEAVERTTVRFAPLDAPAIQAYLAAYDPLDKAGAYAIQGPGALVIEGIQGCYYNVVGLPLNALERLFQRLGRSLLREPALRRDA